jgi:hypothetical protein
MSESEKHVHATTIMGEQGDVTIVWTEDEDDRMEAIIAEKMTQGVVFFIIEPRFFGLLPAKRTELTDATVARKHLRRLRPGWPRRGRQDAGRARQERAQGEVRQGSGEQ